MKGLKDGSSAPKIIHFNSVVYVFTVVSYLLVKVIPKNLKIIIDDIVLINTPPKKVNV